MSKKQGHIRNVITNVVTGTLITAVVTDVTVPYYVLRNADGTPIRNDDGSYIYTR